MTRLLLVQDAQHLLLNLEPGAAARPPDQAVVAVEEGDAALRQVEERLGRAALLGRLSHPDHIEPVTIPQVQPVHDGRQGDAALSGGGVIEHKD